MQKVLVDTFIVPEGSKTEFLERARRVQLFLKTLPGFVEGFVYEKTSGDNRFNFVTTAVWENESAFENAGKAVAAEFQRLGYNPEETRKALKIGMERGVYHRSRY